MWQQDEAFPQWEQTLLSTARALPVRCWVAQLSPGLRRDARGGTASPGSSGEELVTGSCDGAELAERWAVRVGQRLRPPSCSWKKRTHPMGCAPVGSCSEECQAVKMIVTAGWERAAVLCAVRTPTWETPKPELSRSITAGFSKRTSSSCSLPQGR